MRTSLHFLCAVVAAAALARAGMVARDQLEAPFDLVYETPSLRTIQLIQAGRNVYDPSVYAAPPFWLTIYTPLYHELVARLPQQQGNPYFAGRFAAMAGMLLAAGSILCVPGSSRWLALLAVGCFFLVRPVVSNTAFLKGDSLGILFASLAVIVVARFPRRTGCAVAAAVLAVLALATKQSLVAALLACQMSLLSTDRRHAMRFASIWSGLLFGVGLVARVAWGPGFVFCLFEAVRNPMTWDTFANQWQLMLVQPVFVLVLLGAMVLFAVRTLRTRGRFLRESPFALYWAASLAVTLATVGKAGASTNYFIEPTLAGLMLLASASREFDDAERMPPRLVATVLLVVLAAGAELATARRADISFTTRETTARTTQAFERLAADIRAVAGPHGSILNLYNTRLAPIELGPDVYVNDPYLYVLLWQSGQLSTDALVEGLRDHAFGSIIAPAGLLVAPDAGPYTRYRGVIAENYRVARRFGDFDLLTPASAR